MKNAYEEMGNGYLVTLSYSTQKTTKEKIIELLSANPKMTRDDLAKVIEVSSNAVKQHLANLQSDGILVRVGGRKTGEWKIKRKINDGK
jgi:ATP-dependent DNA helicase RecG